MTRFLARTSPFIRCRLPLLAVDCVFFVTSHQTALSPATKSFLLETLCFNLSSLG